MHNTRWYIYPITVLAVFGLWLAYMVASDSWYLFNEFWPVSATMTFGSFIAGATAQGGAAVSFPVFTKVLNIPTPDARTFGLMIQSVGMLMAALLIYTRRIPVLPKIIWWVTGGGVIGQILGTFLVVFPSAPTRVLFTFVLATFGVALAIARWGVQFKPRTKMPAWGHFEKALFFVLGIVGGIFAANTGAGTDMLTFIVLTLAYGINEKISVPTTVIIMGINAAVGFFLRGVFVQDIGITFNYWLVSIPIVIFGAPLGAWVISRCPRDWVIIFLLALVAVEFISTLILVPFDPLSKMIAIGSVIIGATVFYLMLSYRQKRADA